MTHLVAANGQDRDHDPTIDTTRVYALSKAEADVAAILGHLVRQYTDGWFSRLTIAQLRKITRIVEWADDR